MKLNISPLSILSAETGDGSLCSDTHQFDKVLFPFLKEETLLPTFYYYFRFPNQQLNVYIFS